MYCKGCGNELKEGARFCPKCGAPVTADYQPEDDFAEYGETPDKKDNGRFLTIVIALGILVVALVAAIIIVALNRSDTPKDADETITEDVTPADDADAAEDMDIAAAEEAIDEAAISEYAEVAEESPEPEPYILPESGSRALTDADLAGLTAQQLTYARNEIYARYGYVFQSGELNEYFLQQPWYAPNPDFDGTLSGVDKQNAEFIKAYQENNNLKYTPQ